MHFGLRIEMLGSYASIDMCDSLSENIFLQNISHTIGKSFHQYSTRQSTRKFSVYFLKEAKCRNLRTIVDIEVLKKEREKRIESSRAISQAGERLSVFSEEVRGDILHGCCYV